MKLQKVIHHLKDGRKKYSTHHGEIEKWDDRDILAMENCRKRHGDSAYLADFSKYATTVAELRERYPNARIIPVVGFETEDHDIPINNEIIF